MERFAGRFQVRKGSILLLKISDKLFQINRLTGLEATLVQNYDRTINQPINQGEVYPFIIGKTVNKKLPVWCQGQCPALWRLKGGEREPCRASPDCPCPGWAMVG